MFNKRNPKYEVLTMKISKYKVVFRRYPAEENNNQLVYFVDIWQKQKLDSDKKSDYNLQVFHKFYGPNKKFDYEFSSDGIWDCLEAYLATLDGDNKYEE